eukprot:Nitzschia sp. Nitz4//scaffold40_size135432//67452//68465//NITZ4_003245-RA/size135432-processed-gene-0.40-mRNA-1//1//CDS//3329551222//6530//frame0
MFLAGRIKSLSSIATRSYRCSTPLLSVSSDSKSLEWESFDFGDAPKTDKRFGDGEELRHLQCTEEEWEAVEKREAEQDRLLRENLDRQNRLWQDLDPETVDKAIEVLQPCLAPDRWDRIRTMLDQRTQQTRFLFENPSNPSNAWACLRTLDSFGIQHVDIVLNTDQFKGKQGVSQKHGMRTAMGSAKWLSLQCHLDTQTAMDAIKSEGYHILCTDVNPSSKDIRDVDWDASGKPLCIVMGNEREGISQLVRENADETFYLPMCGMAESFNLSVATAITLAHLSATSVKGSGKGPLRPGDLSSREYQLLLLRGAIGSMKPRVAKALFARHGLSLPTSL